MAIFTRVTAGLFILVCFAAVITGQVLKHEPMWRVWSWSFYGYVALTTVWTLLKPYLPCFNKTAGAAGDDVEKGVGKKPKEQPQGVGAKAEPGHVGESKPLVTGSAPPAKPRMYYLDNLKSALTCLVVIHHTTCQFSGYGWYMCVGNYHSYFQAFGTAFTLTNQSYFMGAFFFISGYFVPTSFERKGYAVFMQDKVKRLGIPFVVWCGVISQLTCLLVTPFAHRAADYDPMVSAGQMWFVGWLLAFMHVYVVTDHSTPVRMNFPSVRLMLVASVPLTAISILLMWAKMGVLLIFAPISIGAAPFYPFFFYGGCMAKRNNWLDAGDEKGLFGVTARHRWALTAVTALAVCGMFAYPFWWQSQHYYEDDHSWGNGTDALELPLVPNSEWQYSLVVGVCSSILTVCMPLVQIDAFRRYCNVSNKWTRRLAGAAYGAYIIHPVICVTILGCYIKVYEHATGVRLHFYPKATSTGTVLESEGWLWGGWAVCAPLVLIISFTIAHVVREYVPGAKHIL